MNNTPPEVIEKLRNAPPNALAWWCHKCGRIAYTIPAATRKVRPQVYELVKGSMNCDMVLNSGTPQQCIDEFN